MNRIILVSLVSVLATAGLLLSCDGISGTGSLMSKGYANISFSKDSAVKTIAPTLDMAVDSYDVTFSRTGYTSVSLSKKKATELASASVELDSGTWTVNVLAYNAAVTQIGTGSAPVTIKANATVTASITVSVLPGNGSLSLNADWTAITKTLIAPSMKGTLTSTSGSITDLSFVTSDKTATYASSAVPCGSYTLALTLYDGTTAIASAADAVLIIAGQTSTGTISSFTTSIGSTGITITVSLPSAVTYTFSISSGDTIAPGANISVTPSIFINSYSWYLDGEFSLTTTTGIYTTSISLSTGTHYLTVIGKSGSDLSSSTIQFKI
jgi:hypothetical protein